MKFFPRRQGLWSLDTARTVTTVVLLLLTLIVATQIATEPVAGTSLLSPIPTAQLHSRVVEHPSVRNGAFSQGNGGWTMQPILSGVQNNTGQDGSPALVLQHFASDGMAQAYQQVHLPTILSAVTLQFSYRIKPGEPPGTSTAFGVQIMTEDNQVLMSDGGNFNGETGWLTYNVTLDSTLRDGIEAAIAAGKRIYLQFFLQNASNSFFEAHVDNVSLLVSGEMPVAVASGDIAFLGRSGNQMTVERMGPTGAGRTTIWTHPDPLTPQLYDVAWNPAATELAFTSNLEAGHSAFHSDIYGIQPDGSGLRRISNPPLHATLPDGRATGTVTGRVYNGYAPSIAPFLLYVEGARATVSLSLAAADQSYPFTVPNVVDMGPGVLQYVVYTWSNNSCAGGKEYAAAIVDVQAGQTVDVGTLTFNGYCNRYDAAQIAWSPDGSRLGALVGTTSHQFNAAGEAIGRNLYNSGDSFAVDLAWSPITNEILTTRLVNGTSNQIFRAQADGSSGAQINIDNQHEHANPVWLPDGSGFLFTYGMPAFALGHYDFATQQATGLGQFANETISNLSVSPDGRYVVFERQLGTATDLWILDRNNPHLLWPLTEDGQSRNPHWSRAESSNPPGSTPTPRPTSTRDPRQTEHVHLPIVVR